MTPWEIARPSRRWLWLLWLLPIGLLAGWLASQAPLASGLLIFGTLLALSAVVWGSSLTQRRLVATMLVCSVLLPGIPAPGLQVRPEELLILALLPAILAGLDTRLNRFDFVFGLIAILTIFSMAWGTLGKGAPLTPRDLMELVKLARFWLFFRVALYPWSEDDIRVIVLTLLAAMAVATVLGILQYTNPAGFGRMVEGVYTQGAAHAGKGRIVGTMPSPNYFAILMASGLAFLVGAMQWYRHRWLLAALGLAMLAVIGVTLSRAGILAAGVVLAVTTGLPILWLRQISYRKWLGLLMVAMIILVMLGGATGIWLRGEFRSLAAMSEPEKLAYSWQNPVTRLIFRFSYLPEGQEDRISRWQTHLEDFYASPWLGWGPGKALQSTVADNGYVLYLRRYGIMGLALYLVLFWQILRVSWKLLRVQPFRSPTWSTALSVLAITLAYLLTNLSVEVLYQLQLMSFFWLVVGINYSSLYFRGGQMGRRRTRPESGGDPSTLQS